MHTSCLIRQGVAHGRVPFDDIFAADAALEAAKIQIIYAAAVNQTTRVIQETGENVSITLQFLKILNRGKVTPSQYVSASIPSYCNIAN